MTPLRPIHPPLFLPPRAPAPRRVPASPRPRASIRAFTLFEIVLVILIMGIIAAALVPPVGANLYSPRLRMAANVLAADIEYCASECIAQPSTPRAISFDVTHNRYSVMDFSTSTPLKHPLDGSNYTNDFSTGRNAQLAGVSIRSVTSDDTPLASLAFDPYGRPLLDHDVIITLAFQGSTLTLQVSATTGDVSISGN